MSVDLHNELLTLRRHLLSMGASVEARVAEAVRALFTRDFDLARGIRMADDEIDAMDLDIEKEALRLLALTQPVAMDLRFILAAMRINTDLERVADLAKSIAKRELASGDHPSAPMPDALREMAERSQRMLSDVLSAMSNNDAAMCETIRKADDQVDDLLKEIFRWAQQEIPDNVDAAPAVINILSIARKLERIADMATNIAEDVIFMTKGDVVRHGRGPRNGG